MFSHHTSHTDRKARLSRRMGRKARLQRNAGNISNGIAAAMQIAVYATAATALTAMLIYVGFENNAVDKRMLLRIIYCSQAVFVTNICFNLIFRFRQTMRDSKIISRVTDIIILLTLIPSFFPHPPHIAVNVLHFLHSRYFLFTGIGLCSVAELSYGSMRLLGRRTNPSLILSASFILFILLGSIVLMLPRCTVGSIRYIDALFMASSAVSMTGLCTVDAAATFTPMGWLVIGVLMQIGALGVLTFTSFFAIFFSGRTSIYNQLLMRDFIYSKDIGRLMPIVLYILTFTLAVEALGAVAVYMSLPEDFVYTDVGHRAAFAAFHSLSSFCNGGFCPLPHGMADSTLLGHANAFYLVTSALIIAGGIGFPNLVNFKDVIGEYFRRLKARILNRRHQLHVHIYDLNTKLVLLFTAILFGSGVVMFYVLEYNNAFEGLPLADKCVRAVFSSATVRTAGFSICGPQQWLGPTLLGAMFLMWVGCASQSMGGGIKVNTFAAVFLNLRSIVRGQKGVSAFGRTLAPSSIRRANAVVCLSIFAIVAYSVIIMLLQPELAVGDVVFECFSAVTTVGMSMGITDRLSDLSKITIASAMFLGRVGILSVLCGLVSNRADTSEMLPTDDIIIN